MALPEKSSNNNGSVELTTTLYVELRKLAASRMARQESPLTLQATALVHEAWIKLGGDEQPNWENRAHFFSSVATVMRDILVDRARRRQRIRHGGNLRRVDLEVAEEIRGSTFTQENDSQLIALNEALEQLKALDSNLAELVNLRYFGGLTINELAEHHGLSVRTTERRLRYARAWLVRHLGKIEAA